MPRRNQQTQAIFLQIRCGISVCLCLQRLEIELLVGPNLFFWNTVDPEGKLGEFQYYDNQHPVDALLDGDSPAEVAGEAMTPSAKIDDFQWQSTGFSPMPAYSSASRR